MTAGEAYELHAAMRQFGIPGIVKAKDPLDLAGAYLVVDGAGRDITAYVLAEAASARRRQPERGFVFAR
ncbi:hypothetical protein [Streptomyces sp. TBY4]|uniref:hypothetical protein n=1 Tax=Streptomyces sp. TBY4 TaxID=2962030 RepID=UPI0020B8F5AF|nr:hypothetical protein [Streptomyces sp. TBY4]MCP3758230.1 hypothetical protein [Streptomyces sp. TBY4]